MPARSSCPEVFCEKGVLRNFKKITGKHLCQSLSFNKVARLRPMNFVKYLRTCFFIEHLRWLLLICMQLLLFIICQVNKHGVSVSCFLGKGFLMFKISRKQGQTW